MTDLDKLQALSDAATNPEQWHWAGNTDTGEPYLATWVKGAGRCQVLSIGSEDRSTTGKAADNVRSAARECDMGDPDELVQDWAHDRFGEPVRDPRLQFMSDLMCVNGRDLAIYEVAPQALTRDDPEVYRADVIGIRHPDAEYLVAAAKAVPELIDEVRYLRAAVERVRALANEAAREERDSVSRDFHGNPSPASIPRQALQDALTTHLPDDEKEATK